MARRRKTSKPLKNEKIRIISLIISVALFFGLIQSKSPSLVGKIVTMAYTYLFGNLSLWLILFSLYLAVKVTLSNKKESLKLKKNIALLLFFIGVLALASKRFVITNDLFMPIKIEHNELSNVITSIYNNEYIRYIGSGVIGSTINLFFTLLFSDFGSQVVSWILIVLGVSLFTGFQIFEWIYEKLQRTAVVKVEKEEDDEEEVVKEKRQFKLFNFDWLFEPVREEEKEKVEEPVVDKKEEKQVVKNYKQFVKIADEMLLKTAKPVKAKQEHIELEKTRTLRLLPYKLPGLDLITPPKDGIKDKKPNQEEIKRLEAVLEEFDVPAKVKGYHIGPSVTQYELEVGKGVKLIKISSLNKEIALQLSKKDVRIQAPIPGKDRVGIELENDSISVVNFKEVLDQEPENSKKNLLSVALGINIMGKPCFCDLATAPHLLVAGSTGSGKSVCINTIIMSILMKARPDEVKLVLIDPKKVELGNYNGIDHLKNPVVTDPKKASEVLKILEYEMDIRYKKFERAGVKKLDEYNQKCFKEKKEPMPYIVCIIDELADLMVVAAKDVEKSIMRITQLARAAGIHLIVATQRPSTDIITGVVKSNIPSRISFAVSSSIDSRTILDQGGAEKLLGRGDMLFKPQNTNTPDRIQGVYIPDEDINRVIDFVKSQSVGDTENMYEAYLEKQREKEEEEARTKEIEKQEALEQEIEEKVIDPAEDLDNLYEEVKNFVVENQKCSISFIQRRFSIGYQRAARIVDSLEANGVVSAQDGSKPRKVLIDR